MMHEHVHSANAPLPGCLAMSAAPDPAPAAHDDGAVTTAASGAGGATAAPEPVVSSGMSLDKAKLAALLTRRGLGSLVSVTPASEGVVNGVFFVEARGATSDATPGGEGGGGVTGQGGHDAAVVSYVLRLTSSHMFGKPVRWRRAAPLHTCTVRRCYAHTLERRHRRIAALHAVCCRGANNGASARRHSRKHPPTHTHTWTSPRNPYHAPQRDAARKTANEISVMQFLAAHTSVPVPRIVAHSSGSSTGGSEELELGHHFMLMEHGGKPLSAVLKAERAATASDAATTDAADERKAGDGVKSAKDDGLTSSRERAYMDHLAEIIAELRRVKFDTCGCFTSLSAGQLQLGPWVQVRVTGTRGGTHHINNAIHRRTTHGTPHALAQRALPSRSLSLFHRSALQFMGGPSKRTCDFYAAMITSHLDDLEAVRTFAPFVPRLRDFVGRVLPEQCAPYGGDPFVLTHYGE